MIMYSNGLSHRDDMHALFGSLQKSKIPFKRKTWRCTVRARAGTTLVVEGFRSSCIIIIATVHVQVQFRLLSGGNRKGHAALLHNSDDGIKKPHGQVTSSENFSELVNIEIAFKISFFSREPQDVLRFTRECCLPTYGSTAKYVLVSICRPTSRKVNYDHDSSTAPSTPRPIYRYGQKLRS